MCNRIDGQITPLQVLLERDVRCRMKRKTGIAGRSLAFGARQRIFFVTDGMQEDREIFTYRHKALRSHLLGRCADDDMVTILDRQTK